jgi:hypothetical protein
MKTLYSNRPCQVEDHGKRGAIAATCGQCHSLALLQQRKQWEGQRKKAHEEYLAKAR